MERGSTQRQRDRRNWRLAAILFTGGGLGAVPADALYRPEHPSTIYLLPLLALVSGAVCWALSTRLSGRWLHLMTAIATLEIALTVWLTGDDNFAIYYILVAFYAAFVFHDRRAIAFQFGLAALCALAPIAYESGSARETLGQGLVLIPTLLLTAGAITYLRERLQTSEEGYRRLAERDPLTGVGNYRILSERLPEELNRHRRYDHPLALIVVDLDDFKRVNDDLGHQYGDRVLQEVAGALMGSVRAHDVVVRHGGDEFAVIAPETGRPEADALAQRLRDAIGALSADGRNLGACTGCAIFPSDAETLDSLLHHADAELRAGKDARPRLSRSPAAT